MSNVGLSLGKLYYTQHKHVKNASTCAVLERFDLDLMCSHARIQFITKVEVQSFKS